MLQTEFDALVTAARRLRANAEQAYDGIVGQLPDVGLSVFDVSAVLPEHGRASLREAHERLLATASAAERIAAAPEGVRTLMPLSLLAALPPQLDAITNALRPMIRLTDQVIATGPATASVTLPFSITVSNPHSETLSYSSCYNNALTATEGALEYVGRLLPLVSFAYEEASLAAVTAEARRLAVQVTTNAEEVREARRSALAGRRKAEDHKAAAEAAASNAEALSADLTHRVQEAQAVLAAANLEVQVANEAMGEKLAVAEDARTQAATLRGAISTSQSLIDEFVVKLSDRNEQFESGGRRLTELTEALAVEAGQAKTIVSEAKSALDWATARGLAEGFARAAEGLRWPTNLALLFTVGTVLLVLGAAWYVFVHLPQTGVNVLPPLVAPADRQGWAALAHTLAALGARLILLSPALYLLVFVNRRYRDFFITREQYAFKAAIGASLPGFRAQAGSAEEDEHAKALTAAAYERLLFNPREATTRDLAGESRGGPLSRWLVRIVARGLQEAQKAKPGETKP